MAVDRSALKLTGVRKQFGSTHIINGVDLDIREGERHALIGPNGAGKSTLFNLISGRFPLTSGQIQLKGQDITNQEPQSINRLGLSRSFQITNIFPKLSVFENLRCAVLWNLGYRYSFFKRISALKDARESADRTLSLIGLEDRREKMAGELTYALIEKVTQGKTLMMVEHDMGVVFNLADRISVLVYGEVIATGAPSEIRNNPRVQEAYLGTQLEDEVSS